MGPEEQRGCFSAFGGVGAAFGVVDEMPVLLAPHVPLRYAMPGGNGKADSKLAERQRMENAGQIGPAPSDARKHFVAGGGPKVSANPGPRENPAKRFSWGEDEHRNERAFGVSRKRGIWRLRGRGPAPNADTDSTSQGPLLGPPYHKQIRHKVPFCAQTFSFPPGAAATEGELPRRGKRSPSGGVL